MTRNDSNREDVADAFYPDDLVLRISDIGAVRARSLVGNDVGPAGVCSLVLADGSVVDVDYAEPERLVHIEPTGDAPLLDLLIGRARARVVRASAPLGDDRGIRIPGRTGRDRGVVTSRPRGGDGARAIGLAATLVALHRDDDELPFVRAVAGFEFVRRFSGAGIDRVIDRTDLAAVLDRSLDLAIADVPSVTEYVARRPKETEEIIRVVEESVTRGGRADDPRVASLTDILRRRVWGQRPKRSEWDGFDDVIGDGLDGRVAMRAAMLSAPLRTFSVDGRDVHSLIPTLTITTPGRLRIEWSIRPAGEWVRVLRSGTQVLLALAPVVRDDDGVWAETVVPPDLGVDDLEIDTVTGSDGDGLEVDTPTERVRAAIDLGRMAVTATIARRRDASELWRRCADAWGALGDDRRARRAEAYANGELEVTRRDTLADRVREVVDRP